MTAMYRIIELTIHKDKIRLIDALKDNPTKVLAKGNYYKFIYFEPLTEYIGSFNCELLSVTIVDTYRTENGWVVVRDLPVRIANKGLVNLIEDLEAGELKRQRQGVPLILEGWLFNAVTNGISEAYEAVLLVKIMYLSGYDFEHVVQLFSAIVKNTDLSRYFIEYSQRLYKEVEQ